MSTTQWAQLTGGTLFDYNRTITESSVFGVTRQIEVHSPMPAYRSGQ